MHHITQNEFAHLKARPYSKSARPRFTQKQIAATARDLLPHLRDDTLSFARYRALFTYSRAWYGDAATIGIYQWLKTQGDAVNPKTPINDVFQAIHWNTDPTDPNWLLYLEMLTRDAYRLDWGDACHYDSDKPVIVTYRDGHEAVTDDWETTSTHKDGVVTRVRKEETPYDNAQMYIDDRETWRTRDPAEVPLLLGWRATARAMYHKRVTAWNSPEAYLGHEHYTTYEATYFRYLHTIAAAAGDNDFFARLLVRASDEDALWIARLIATDDIPRRIRANIVREPVKVIARKGERTDHVVTLSPAWVRLLKKEDRIRLADTIEEDHRMAAFNEDPHYEEVTKLTGVRIPAPSKTRLSEWVDVELHQSEQGMATSYDRTLGLRDATTHRLATKVSKAQPAEKEQLVETVDWLTFLGENIYDLEAKRIVQVLRLILNDSADRFHQAAAWLTDVYGEITTAAFTSKCGFIPKHRAGEAPAAIAA